MQPFERNLSRCGSVRYEKRVYLEFYGLREMPFDLAPNPRFLYFSPRHREAFNHVLYGIRERKGFVQFTGEVGCGKTTICRAILRELGDHFATALILNPILPADQLLQAVAIEFGLPVKGLDRFETLSALNQFLIDLVVQGRDAVLIIDEAQDLTTDLLEQIRLLSNLETDERKLLQIVLLGQPELRERLNGHSLRQLRQRITVRFHLDPLRSDELLPYIRHRLIVAGGNGIPAFTRPALWRIHHYTKGIPRLVNAVCDKCLLAGYVNETYRINFSLAATAVRELEGTIEA
jgi:general secretion pathway protein A